MNTHCAPGDIPVIVANPLGFARTDLAEAAVCFPGGNPERIAVLDKDSTEIPSQVSGIRGDSILVLFPARNGDQRVSRLVLRTSARKHSAVLSCAQ